MTNLIPFNIFASVTKAYLLPQSVEWFAFEQVVEQCNSSQMELKNKTDGFLFNCCSWISDFESPDWDIEHEFIRRCKMNVDKIYVLLLDVDGKMTLDEAVKVWQDYEFYIYSTYSHSAKKDKFRLIVPLLTPLTCSEFMERHKTMVEEFNVVDGASFTLSQCFYFPSYSVENKHLAFTYWNRIDNRYDALLLPKIQLNQNINTDKPTYDDSNPHPLAKVIYNTLLSGSGLRYADALPLAALCKSKGMSCSDYISIVNHIAATDSTLRTIADLKHLYSEGYTCFMTDKKSIELMQRLHCDMWRWIKS